ncbi:hypothetical protein BH23ACT5_BH23ACT5_02110 [soil metagenome]
MQGVKFAKLAIVTAVAALLAAIGGLAAAADSGAEDRFVSLINDARQDAGARTLTVEPVLVEVARAHAQKMADSGTIFHNDQLGYQVEGHYMMGENVGKGGEVEALHAAFMDSPPHRANLLNSVYDAVGVGVVDRQGTLYVVEVFMHSKEGKSAAFTPPFSDDDGSVHEADIGALYRMGVTRGCGVARYCPDRPVTRGELATMLVRTFDLTGSTTTQFTDTSSSEHAGAISVLADTGITNGCGPAQYCPHRAVTRGELATFFSRLLGLPVGSATGFVDVAGSEHQTAIGALAASGITKGCTGDKFCPDSPVTRGQLASFLVRALERG